MTITIEHFLKAIGCSSNSCKVDLRSVIYIDNGIDCIECRNITVMRPVNGSPKARQDLYESVSGKDDGEMPEDDSVVLRLAN